MKLYQSLARLVGAIHTTNEKCGLSDNPVLAMHEDKLELYTELYFPSGSGFDGGTVLDMVNSTPEKLLFKSAYHLMNENGYYAGWLDLTITVTSSLLFDYKISIKGQFSKHKEAVGLKEYIDDVFSAMLDKEV